VRYNLMFPMRAVKHWSRWCEGAGIGDVARLVEDAASIAALGGVDTVIPVDACHEVMFSHPARLAEILIQRCRLRG